MAIVVEQEQKGSGSKGLGGLIAWSLIFVIIAVAIYYVFFKRPDLVDTVTSSGSTNQVLSQINLKPDDVLESANFKALQSYTQPVASVNGGRTNPFYGTF